MTDRIPLDHLTSDALDQLYAERDRLIAELDDYDQRVEQLTGELEKLRERFTNQAVTGAELAEQLGATETERDGAYRERAHLLAWLATHHPAVITLAPDIDEPGWKLLHITAGDRQVSWHIAPRDDDLFEHVERVTIDDPRAQWDGHTTDEKYDHIRRLAGLPAPAPASAWTPPPPGDRREQLPDHLLTLIHIPPYLSTACQTARYLEAGPEPTPIPIYSIPEVGPHIDRLHARCRLNHKFTGQPCICDCHTKRATP